MCVVCDRRSLIRGIAGMGLLAMAGRPAAAQRSAASVSTLPARGEYLIQGAMLISMDPAVGDVPDGAVHVRDGVILQAGRGITAPSADIIPADGAIIMPGLVETHWHMLELIAAKHGDGHAALWVFPNFGATRRILHAG